MMRSLSLRTRCATASRRGSAAVADLLAPALDARLAPELDARERERLLVPLLLLRVVRLAPVDRLPLARVPLDRVPLEREPVERRDELRPDEPPELEPEPLLLAWGMPASCVGTVQARTLLVVRARCRTLLRARRA